MMSLGADQWRTQTRLASFLVALMMSSRLASAQTTQSNDAREAERTALYRTGVEASAAGRWAEARERFAEALAIRASPKVFFSLAQAEEQLGQVASAHADYGRALAGGKAAHESDVVTAAERAQRTLDPRVPHVRILVTGASAATATMDGQAIAVSAALAVDPGAHQLVVNAPGMREVRTSVAIGESQQLDVPVSLEPESAGAPAQPAPVAPTSTAAEESPAGTEAAPSSNSGSSPWRTVGLVTAGVGVVGLGVGTAFGLVAKSKNDASNSSGCNGNNCTSQAAATRRDALSAANVSTVAFVAGGVLAASGVVLWLAAPKGDADQGVGVTPVALGAGGGIQVTGGW